MLGWGIGSECGVCGRCSDCKFCVDRRKLKVLNFLFKFCLESGFYFHFGSDFTT